MNVQKYIVNGNNWMSGRQGNPVRGIVLHTMVGTSAGAQSRFDNPTSQVSVHYGVALDGAVYQWVEESDTAYQAGNWNVNLDTIGIEHEDNGNYNDAVRTDALYASSAQLVAEICRRYGFPCDSSHIFLHKNVIDQTAFPGGTACPDGLDTARIMREANAILNPVAPAPTPPPAGTIEPIGLKQVELVHDANLWDLSFTSYPNARVVKSLPMGTIIVVAGIYHHPLGSKYYLSQYSYDHHINNGINVADCEDYVAPAPTVPTPTPVPVVPTLPTTPVVPAAPPVLPDLTNNVPVPPMPIPKPVPAPRIIFGPVYQPAATKHWYDFLLQLISAIFNRKK